MNYETLDAALDGHADQPFRVRQRICAFYLAQAQGDNEFTSKELRLLCKEHECFNSPNFSRNLKQEPEFFSGSSKEGWSLTEEGLAKAKHLFGRPNVGTEADPTTMEDLKKGFAAVGVPAAQTPLIPDIFLVKPQTPQEPEKPAEVPVVVEAPIKPITEPQAVAATIVAPMPTPRPPRVRGTDMLAALFHKIESEDSNSK